MSGEEGSLGEIRRALVGITRQLDALASAVGVAAAAPAGALLDEVTRARLSGLESLRAIGRAETRAEACLLAVDRALTHALADCAAILQATGERTFTVVHQRGFRVPLEPSVDEGIVGRALHTGEVVHVAPGLGGPDALLERNGLAVAVAVPVPDREAMPTAVVLVGRRRPVPFDADAVATLTLLADHLVESLRAPSDATGADATPVTLFENLDPASTAQAVAREAVTRLGAEVAAVFLVDDDRCVLAGAMGRPHDTHIADPSRTLDAVKATRQPWISAPDAPGDPELGRCLGTTPRAVLPLSADGALIALLAVGSTGVCRTALPPSFARAAALALRNARLHAESLRAFAQTPHPITAAAQAGPAPLGDMASLLAVVLGRLAAARERVTDPPSARDLADAEEAAWRVAEAVRRVLGFAPASGRQEAPPLNLGQLVRDTVEWVQRGWAGEGGGPVISLDLELVPPVLVDPDDFRQVLYHLLQNAREASDGPAAIDVRLRWDGGSGVELSVSDGGQGMDEATRARACEPFFTTKGPGRLGIGLSVAQAMAARHHGTLALDTAPGRGTAVHLRLPTAAGSRPGPVRPEPVSPAHCHVVLLVDDDQVVRETLREGLAQQGYVVHAAGDVGDAIALLGRERVDLVVTDLVLPGGSGLEIARTVKRIHPHTPVIMVTGWPGRVEVPTLESHGIDAVVEKPVGLDTLRATVATLIERAAARPR